MAAAELKLQVGLDLTFFRQQLAQLASASVGYSLPINIDRLAIQKEITKLGRNISSRKYTLKIDTTVKSAASDISNLQKALEELEKKSVNVQITGTGNLNPKEARRIRAALGRSVLSNGGKIKIPATIQAAITKDDVTAFRNAVKSKLAGISVDVKANVRGKGFAGTEHGYAGVMQYMQKEGLIGKTASGMTGQMGKNGDDIKQQLSDAVKSAEKIKSVFDGVAKSIATTGKSTANVQGKRLSLGNVPLMAGGVERRIEKSSAAIGATLSADALKALYPEVSKTIASFVALKGQIQQNTSKLSGFSLILGLAAFAGVPLAKSVVKLTGSADSFAKLLDQLGLKLDAAFTKAAFNILSATSGRMLSGGSVAGLLPAAYRGIGGSAGPAGLLPPAYRGIGSSRNAGALPPAYRGLPFGFDFRGLPPKSNAMNKAGKLGPTVQQIRQQRLSSLRIEEAQVRDISGPFDVASSFNSSQKAASQRRLNKAVADFVKGLEDIASRAIAQKSVQQVNVSDLGRAISNQAMLPGRTQAPLMLPAAGGTTAIDRMRISTGAYVGQPGFMQAPSIPPPVGGGGAPPAPPTPPGGGRGGFGSFGSFGGAMPNVSLPGAGLVKELGDQFGYAAKQVLLFGAAYKALAFLTEFPAKVGEAVAQLQTFRNTLQSITPNADEFQKSNQFILDTVDKYNTPLQSARDGFTKLYASMAPAGFKGDDIRNIFAGISQGAATFGMSADKVDRVNYAFAQMASKGQVMSEELKGQLGDVLPGAVAIFAKAAGFEGPDAMVKFTKAMEDGRYKGEAMKQLLINVGIVMKDKFAAGAEGAAQTFQGQMNAMANATKKLYEAFVPAGNLFSSQIIAPFTSGLEVLADGFNAFFAGQQAATKGGAELAAKLQDLRPTFEGLAANAKAVASRVIELSKAFLPLLELGARLLSSPLVGVLAQIYASVLLVNGAFSMLAATGITRATAALITGLIPATQQSTFLMYQLTLVSRGMWLAITGPAGLAVLAIAAVTAALYAMHEPSREYLDTVPSRFADFWKDLQSQAIASVSGIVKTWNFLESATSETFRSMTNSASGFYDGLVAQLGPIAPWFGDMMQWLKNAWMETIAFMINQSHPVLGIAKILGVDVGKTLIKNLTKDKTLPVPGQFTPAGGVSFDAQGNPIGASLSPFIPGSGNLRAISAASGNERKGAGGTDKAAKAERQSQDRLRSLSREIELAAQLATLKELQFEAEIAGDRELQIRLQGEERSLGILHATASALDGITDGRLRQKELAKAEAQIFAERRNVAFNLIRLDEERARSFEDVIADLNLELRLKKATTEQAREQLRLEAERMKLTRQKLFTPEQIDAIMQKKGELARPQTDAEKVQARIDELRRGLDELTNPANTLIGIAGSIGDSFGASFKGIIDGSMTAQQALAGFFQNLSNYFADAVSKMIAEWLKIEALKGLKSLLPNLFGGGTGFAFTGDSGLGAVAFGSGFQVPDFTFANGGIAPKGFQAFATGGIVTGPTLGLVGEGRYNEAVIPLPDGKSVPVDLGGMSGGGGSPINVVVNVDAKGSTVEGDENRANDLGRAISVAVQSELVKQQRPGGLLASTRR